VHDTLPYYLEQAGVKFYLSDNETLNEIEALAAFM